MYLLKQAFITLNFSVVKLLLCASPFLNIPVSVGQASRCESKIMLLFAPSGSQVLIFSEKLFAL